ncbi:MAG: hypothetical protein IJX17_04715 [Clostridia bacterium]|nr:hypothetical protein [Clostridia bacterium]
MDKCIYKGVDIFNPIEGKIQYFVDSFVKIYGEKHRTVIERRLKNAKYFFLGCDFDVIIKKYQELKQEELKKIDNSKNMSPSLKKLKKNEIKEKYDLIIGVFEDTKKKLTEIDERYERAIENYISDRINLVRGFNKKPKLKNEEVKKYVPTLLGLLYFGETEFLKTKNLLSDSRKEQYIKLFNAMGYEEKDINGYYRNRKLLDDIFDRQTIRQLNYWSGTKKEEINKANFCVAEMNYHLSNLQIYGSDDEYFKLCSEFIKNLTGNSAFVVNCLSEDSKFNTLCLCKNALELTVEDLVHEMGHIIDSFVVDSSQSGYFYKNGYEIHYHGFTAAAKKNSEFDPKSKKYRNSELFNEMVNEYICLKVADEFKKTGKTVAFKNRTKGAKILYQFGFEVFEDFLEKYQDKLIEFKLSVDKNEKAYKYFGESNFKKLTLMVRDYINKRSELNLRAYRGDKSAFDEIEQIKLKTKLEFAKLEKEIEEHIEKEKLKQEKEEAEKLNDKENNLGKLIRKSFLRFPKRFEGVKTFRALFNKNIKNKSEEKESSNENENEKTM